ncbi:MAG: tyrosine-type recombinase/integrase, partial [Thermoleophilaceae bacterium]
TVAAAFVFDDVVAPAPDALPSTKLFFRVGVLEPADVQAMLAACSTSSRVGLRDRALIAAGYYACVRPLEALQLQPDDVDEDAGALTVRGTNGTRVVLLPTEGAAALAAWADKRRRLRKPLAHVGLFCTLEEGSRPARVTRQVMQEAMERVARAARVAKSVGLDELRAARAKELALSGVELPALADLLDHMHLKAGRGETGHGLRQDLERTRQLVTELAPQAPCVGFYRRPLSVICQPGYATGRAPVNKGKSYPAEVLTPDELREMLRQLPKSGPFRFRNRALIVCMWRCGLRIAEALALEVRDVDLKMGTLTVRHGKGDKRRVVGIDPQAGRELERWLEARQQLGLDAAEPVFCTLTLPYRGRPMSYTNAREMLQGLGRKAGIQKRVHLHGLRHTHAFELMQEGVPLPIIQKQLGHSDLITTARYVDHLAPVHVIKAMQAREWAFTR